MPLKLADGPFKEGRLRRIAAAQSRRKVGFGIFLGSKLFRQVGQSVDRRLVFPRREQTCRLKPGLEARQVWERLISPLAAAALTVRRGKTRRSRS